MNEVNTPPAGSVSGKIGRDTIGVSVVGAVTRIAPLFSTITIAAFFGTSSGLDVYYLTLVVPIFLAGLVGMAITTVFVPVLIEERDNDPDAFPRLVNSLFSWVLFIALGLTTVHVAAVPFSIPLISGAFDDEGRRLAVNLSLGLSPIIPLITTRSLLVALYHSRKQFILPTAAMSLTPVFTIAAVFVFTGAVKVHALVIGNVAGHAAEVLVLLYFLARSGSCPRLTRGFDGKLKKIFKLSLPQVVSSSVLRLNPFIDRTMASLLAAGSISALVYAERMQSVPQQILSLGFFNVVLAHWSFERLDAGLESVGDSLIKIQRVMTKVLIPSLCFLWIYRRPLISLFLERGELSSSGAGTIASVFGVYVFQIFPLLMTLVYVRVMLVMKDTAFLMRVGIGNAASKVGLNCLFLFGLGMGVEGIALSTVVTSWIIFFVFLFALRRKLGIIPFRFGPRESLVTVFVTVAAAAASRAVWLAAVPPFGEDAAVVLTAVMFFCLCAFLFYVLREPQYFVLRRLVARR